MQESNGRRKYDRQFKEEAVRLVTEGRQVTDVARSLGIHENLLHTCIEKTPQAVFLERDM